MPKAGRGAGEAWQGPPHPPHALSHPGCQPSPGAAQHPAPVPSGTPSHRDGTAAPEASMRHRGVPMGWQHRRAQAALSLPCVTALPGGCQPLQLQQSRSNRPRLAAGQTCPLHQPQLPKACMGGRAAAPSSTSSIYKNTLLWKRGARELFVQYKPTAVTRSLAHRHATAAPEAHPWGTVGPGGATATTSLWAWR